MKGGDLKFGVYGVTCNVFTEDIQYLEPFTFLYAAALAVEPVVKLRLVVLPSCDVYLCLRLCLETPIVCSEN